MPEPLKGKELEDFLKEADHIIDTLSPEEMEELYWRIQAASDKPPVGTNWQDGLDDHARWAIRRNDPS